MYTMYRRGWVRIVIKGRMRGESCEDVVYAIVYGMRVIFDPIRDCYNIVQEGPERDLRDCPAVQGARLTAQKLLQLGLATRLVEFRQSVPN